MDEKLIKNAEEARIEKEKSSPTTTEIMFSISKNVDCGFLCRGGYIGDNVIMELIGLGFKVSKVSGQFGENITKIEW